MTKFRIIEERNCWGATVFYAEQKCFLWLWEDPALKYKNLLDAHGQPRRFETLEKCREAIECALKVSVRCVDIISGNDNNLTQYPK